MQTQAHHESPIHRTQRASRCQHTARRCGTDELGKSERSPAPKPCEHAETSRLACRSVQQSNPSPSPIARALTHSQDRRIAPTAVTSCSRAAARGARHLRRPSNNALEDRNNPPPRHWTCLRCGPLRSRASPRRSRATTSSCDDERIRTSNTPAIGNWLSALVPRYARSHSRRTARAAALLDLWLLSVQAKPASRRFAGRSG